MGETESAPGTARRAVAEAPRPALDGNAMTQVIELKCEKCGKVCASPGGLGVHRARCGRPKQARQARTAKAKPAARTRTATSAPLHPASLVREIFEQANAVIDGQAQHVEEILKGYEVYVGKLKRLRLAYMKNRVRLEKLRTQARQFDGMNDERSDVE